MELLGNAGHEEPGDGDTKPRKIPGMQLGIRDVPTLAPFLREDRLILAVGFWRTFHPSRTLTGTRELLALTLRRAAKRDLVDPREWRTLDAIQVDERIGRIIAWAEGRKDKTESELLLETLEDLAKRDASWLEAGGAAFELADKHEPRAVPLLGRWLRNDKTEDSHKQEILLVMRRTDAKEAKTWAEEFLDGKGEPGARAEAAFTLLATGDRERAFQVLGKEFPKYDYSFISADYVREIVGILTKDNSSRAWDILGRLFDDSRFATLSSIDSVDLCRSLEAHGNAGGLQAYRKLLDNMETSATGMPYTGRPVAYVFGDKLLEGYASHDRAAKKILAGTRRDSEQRRKATCDWLDGRIKNAAVRRQADPSATPTR